MPFHSQTYTLVENFHHPFLLSRKLQLSDIINKRCQTQFTGGKQLVDTILSGLYSFQIMKCVRTEFKVEKYLRGSICGSMIEHLFWDVKPWVGSLAPSHMPSMIPSSIAFWIHRITSVISHRLQPSVWEPWTKCSSHQLSQQQCC